MPVLPAAPAVLTGVLLHTDHPVPRTAQMERVFESSETAPLRLSSLPGHDGPAPCRLHGVTLRLQRTDHWSHDIAFSALVEDLDRGGLHLVHPAVLPRALRQDILEMAWFLNDTGTGAALIAAVQTEHHPGLSVHDTALDHFVFPAVDVLASPALWRTLRTQPGLLEKTARETAGGVSPQAARVATVFQPATSRSAHARLDLRAQAMAAAEMVGAVNLPLSTGISCHVRLADISTSQDEIP